MNNFDEIMPVVQISIGNCEIMDVLLDGGFGVTLFLNICEGNWA
jgi:hypothetical protein